MPSAKLTVTVQQASIAKLDRWVREGRYPNRSQAAQAALDLLERRNQLPTLAEALATYRSLSPEEKQHIEAEAEETNAFFDKLDAAYGVPDGTGGG